MLTGWNYQNGLHEVDNCSLAGPETVCPAWGLRGFRGIRGSGSFITCQRRAKDDNHTHSGGCKWIAAWGDKAITVIVAEPRPFSQLNPSLC